MKFLCTVLYVLIVVAFIGSATSDEAAGGEHGTQTPAGGGHETHTSAGGEHETHTSAGDEHVCDVDTDGDHDPHALPSILSDRLVSCLHFDSVDLREGIAAATTTEDFRRTLKTHCDNLPAIVACTANVTTQVEHCLNESLAGGFKVVRNDLDTFIRVVCRDDGVKVAAIIEEVKNYQNRAELKASMLKCVGEITRHTVNLDGNDASRVSATYYRMADVTKRCITEAAPDSTVFNELVQERFDELLEKLMCVHPVTKEEVLCHTFIN